MCVWVYVCVCVCVCIYVCLCFVKMAFPELQLVYCSGQRCGQEGWRAAVVPPAAATVQAEPADVEAKQGAVPFLVYRILSIFYKRF